MSENIKIADMQFAYNNSALIHALRERGSYIALQQFDKVQQQDGVINNLFKDFESMTRPTAAFITFEEEDAAIIAMKLNTEQRLLD